MTETDDIERVRATVRQMQDVPAPGHVWEHGEDWTPDFDRLVVDEGRRAELFVDEAAPEHVRKAVREFARNEWPGMGECYCNALLFADATGAEYVEGYARLGDGSRPSQAHAWNVLDGYVVDVTSTWTAGYGAVIDDEHVSNAVELGREENWWGVVFNEVYDGLL